MSTPGAWVLPEAVHDVCKELHNKGYLAYVVGGAVRDLLLGLIPKDYDLVTDAKVEDIERIFPKVLGLGRKFAIMVVQHKGEEIELASFRIDGVYEDGRRPESVIYAQPKEDALRRDFTINGMFWDTHTKQLIDYVGGEKDLEARCIRTIGSANKRYQEDALRILRALRFYSQLGSLGFFLEKNTLDAISQEKHLLSKISKERITEELNKTLLGKNAAKAVALFHELSLEEVLFPDWTFKREISQGLQHLLQLDLPADTHEAMAWEIFLHYSAGPKRISVTKNLVLRKEIKKFSEKIHMLRSKFLCLDSLYAQKKFVLDPVFSAYCTLTELLGASEEKEKLRILIESKKGWEKAGKLFYAPLFSAADLIQIGLPQGPEIKKALKVVEEAQYNEHVLTKEEAIQWLKREGFF